MNKIDDGKFNLKGNNESFSYLGSVSPEEEARLAEIRKKKSKKKTRLIAGLLAGGTLIGGITASYLKNNALISPYTSDIGQELFNTPEYKEIYKKYKNYTAFDLNWTQAGCSLVGFYTQHWGLTEEEALMYTSVDKFYIVDNKLYITTIMIRDIKSEYCIDSFLEYELDDKTINNLISLQNSEELVSLNLLIQQISKTLSCKIISEHASHTIPLIMIDYGNSAESAECLWNFDNNMLGGYCFVNGKMLYVYNDKITSQNVDENGAYLNSSNLPVCQIGETIGDVKLYYDNFFQAESRARDLEKQGLLEK